MTDEINHPAHYNHGKIEIIDAIEDWKLGYNDGNAVKYVGRHKHKGTPIKCLKKAVWYLNREIGRLEALKTLEVKKAFDETLAAARDEQIKGAQKAGWQLYRFFDADLAGNAPTPVCKKHGAPKPKKKKPAPKRKPAVKGKRK